jgi:hypothetical protein
MKINDRSYADTNHVRFEVLPALNMKLTGLWDVTLCHLVEMYHRVGGTLCLHLQGRIGGTLEMETAGSSATLVPFY